MQPYRAAAYGLALLMVCGAAPADEGYWWQRYPTFAQIDDNATFARSLAKMNLHGPASDPTWGPYAQRLTELDQVTTYPALRATGARVITWIEAFGDCMLYAATLDQQDDGSFARREDDPRVARLCRTHWCWANKEIPPGNVFRWVGVHNTTSNEDFVLPDYGLAQWGLPAPTYPDGRPATGWLPTGQYPLTAEVYDACGSKDLNGRLAAAYEVPEGVNDLDPATGLPRGPVEGLFPAVTGMVEVPRLPGLKDGDPVYCGVISVHKDLSAPFWLEYARLSVREILKQSLDGLWCDNYSPWDNFGYDPALRAFGDWSVYRFHQYLRQDCTPETRAQLGIKDLATFDVREHLKRKAAEFGAADPTNLDDAAWRDVRWLDEPVWNAFKAFRQRRAQEDLAAYYAVIHEEAVRAGRPDFCVSGNDVPFYGLGWTRDGWLDMINTEINPGWHMGTGSRGILVPPVGKMAVVYRVAREHQKGPFSAAWYYLDGPNEKYQRKPEMGKVLVAEAFANGAFLMCCPDNPRFCGTLESHAWWNGFVRDHEADFGERVPRADVGVLFSPDNQLALLTPRGYPDMDRQPHIFGHYGWATALVDAHVPYRAVTDWRLDAAHLAGLRVFIVPDAECLDKSAAEALGVWVRGGGRLIVTGPSGVRCGPSGDFARRPRPVLEDLLGADVRLSEAAPVRRDVGRGEVYWTPRPLGMDYYLQASERPRLLADLTRLVGGSGVVRAERLPTTVGVFTWQSPSGQAVFSDLVNYDISETGDTVRPAERLEWRVRVPPEWQGVKVLTLSPDADPPAEARVERGWATVRLPYLRHFASVRLTRAGEQG
ncbi:MAG: hypothetical protein HPY69_12525 [Armatimonadetes bacterium]|nr:hypothetical protein [Armatimonadota bacterium]